MRAHRRPRLTRPSRTTRASPTTFSARPFETHRRSKQHPTTDGSELIGTSAVRRLCEGVRCHARRRYSQGAPVELAERCRERAACMRDGAASESACEVMRHRRDRRRFVAVRDVDRASPRPAAGTRAPLRAIEPACTAGDDRRATVTRLAGMPARLAVAAQNTDTTLYIAEGSLIELASHPLHAVTRQSARQSAVHRGPFLGARPRGAPTPPGPSIRTPATIAPRARPSEPKSPSIHGNPRLSPRFQALVPEMERDHRRFKAIPETTKPPHVQGHPRDGARGTRVTSRSVV
jgi:hypothetical protein